MSSNLFSKKVEKCVTEINSTHVKDLKSSSLKSHEHKPKREMLKNTIQRISDKYQIKPSHIFNIVSGN